MKILLIILIALIILTPIGFIIYNIFLERRLVKAFKEVIENDSKEIPKYIKDYYYYHKENIKSYFFILSMFIINILILLMFFS